MGTDCATISSVTEQTSQPRLADLPELLTVDEARSILRMGRSSMYEALRTHKVPSRKLGGKYLIPKAALERLLAIT